MKVITNTNINFLISGSRGCLGIVASKSLKKQQPYFRGVKDRRKNGSDLKDENKRENKVPFFAAQTKYREEMTSHLPHKPHQLTLSFVSIYHRCVFFISSPCSFVNTH